MSARIEDEIDELDQPLFPESKILAGDENPAPVNSRFFEIRNETGSDGNVDDLTTTTTTPVAAFEEEFTTWSYFNDYEFDQVRIH